MLEQRPRTKPAATTDGYKVKRAAYSVAAEENHAMFCYFFGKPFEPVPEIQTRLNQQLNAHTVNKMKQEIAEINAEEP
jgi:hypothetical protein